MGNDTFKKRQKEIARREKQQKKAARRNQRRNEQAVNRDKLSNPDNQSDPVATHGPVILQHA
jgi:hypothetical protein